MALGSWSLPETAAHQPSPNPGTGDGTLAIWRCSEALASDDFVAAGLSRTLTKHSNPGVATSLFQGADGTGARTFNGLNQYADRTTDADETLLQGAAVMVTGWLFPTIPGFAGAAQCVLAYTGVTAGASGSNTQLSVRIDGSGVLFVRWQNGARVDVDAVGPTLADRVLVHVGILIDQDPNEFGKRRVRFFIDGVLTTLVGNLAPPDGGADALWILGADNVGAGPSLFYRGNLSDIGVYTFVSPEFVRHCYARGIKDWQINVSNIERPFYEVHTRVLLEDRLGALGDTSYSSVDGWVDLTALFGWNWLLSAELEEDVDAQVSSASFELISRIGEMAMPPFLVDVNDGTADIYKNVLNENDDLLAENNQVKIEVAIVPYGTTRWGAEPYWMLRFHGLIARVDAGEAKTTVHCVDLMGALQDIWIEPKPSTGEDYEYGDAVGTPVEEVLQAIVDDNDPKVFEIRLVDDSGPGNAVVVDVLDLGVTPVLGKPHLFAAADRFLLDGTVGYDGEYNVDVVTDESIQAVETTGGAVASETVGYLIGLEGLFGYAGGLPELYVPTSPGWDLKPFRVPASQSVASALEDVPSHIDFAVRYAWDDDRQHWRLTLSRFTSVAIATVSLRNVLAVGSQRADKENERDVIAVEYSDAALLDVEGNPRRMTVVATNPGSQQRYKRRYARVGLASYGLVSEAAEAQEMADRMVIDLANPQAEAEVTILFHPKAVLGGSLAVPGENHIVLGGMQTDIMPRAFSEASSMGLTKLRTSMKREGVRQVATTRRDSTSATRTTKHRDLIQQRGYTKTLGLKPPDSSTLVVSKTALSLGGSVRGVHVSWTHPTNDTSGAWDYFEVHVATSGSGFTPTSSTLLGTTRGTSFVDVRLATGTTYYLKLVIRDRMGNISDAFYAGSFATAA